MIHCAIISETRVYITNNYVDLNQLQRKICNILQQQFPICPEPFAQMASMCEITEEVLINEVRALERSGILKRISGLINYSAIGRTSVLVAGHVPDAILNKVVSGVNMLDGVSHNYLRDHHLNLWFTLQADSNETINQILSNLALQFGVSLLTFPAKSTFKLKAVFGASQAMAKKASINRLYTGEAIPLNACEKYILERVSEPLEIVSRPFDFMCNDDLGIAQVMDIIGSLCERGVIRRISGILDQRMLGYAANVLFVAYISKRLKTIARQFVKLDIVTHCYEREAGDNWSYNFYAMTHAKTLDDIKALLEPIIKQYEIKSFEYLPTLEELKKQPVKLKFDE